ncbi:MAG: hypothetical protein PUH21_02035 [Prevotellaceae bacterium]|nr:hypothetical protein [Prevotellaceae bacterium]MDY3855554.1 hypothetical protein [Bacteroidaceae bacterium]
MNKYLITLLFIGGMSCAVSLNAKTDIKKVTYQGNKISLASNQLQCQFVAKLKGHEKQAYQGMDICGNVVASCQNSGWISFYNYDGKRLTQIIPPYKMDCYDKINHSNAASFSNYKYDSNDPLPLLYVSQASKHAWQGNKKDVLFVERIAPDLKSTKTVQTIYYKDENHNFGYALQWVIDRDNDYLYGFGNTITNTTPTNKHRIVKFRLPECREGSDSIITLTDKDLLENYLIEDTYGKYYQAIDQGLFIKNGLLFMPTGFGKPSAPSMLYVWDLQTRRMHNILDLTKATFSELEDCSAWNNSLMIQAQGNMFRIDF